METIIKPDKEDILEFLRTKEEALSSFVVDYEIVLDVVRNKIPELVYQLEMILEDK